MAYKNLTKDQHIAISNSVRKIRAEILVLTEYVSYGVGKSSKAVSGLRRAEKGLMSAASDLENTMFVQLGSEADDLGFPHYNSNCLTSDQKAIRLSEVFIGDI